MPATFCPLLSYLTFPESSAVSAIIIIAVLEMRKLKPRKVKSLVQGYTANKMKNQDSEL